MVNIQGMQRVAVLVYRLMQPSAPFATFSIDINCSITKDSKPNDSKNSWNNEHPKDEPRIVLPFEIRAMNMPTNGAQDNHQAQNSMVQLKNHGRVSCTG